METPSLNYTDHDLLIRIHTLLEVAQRDLASFKQYTSEEIGKLWSEKGSKVDIADHELRLRAIERRLWIGFGGMTVILGGLEFLFKNWK